MEPRFHVRLRELLRDAEVRPGLRRGLAPRLETFLRPFVASLQTAAQRRDHALIDVRLYLPKEWARDRRRRKVAGVPKGVRFRTRHQLALDMLAEWGDLLPHAWVAGDDEMGRCSRFRAELREREEAYLL